MTKQLIFIVQICMLQKSQSSNCRQGRRVTLLLGGGDLVWKNRTICQREGVVSKILFKKGMKQHKLSEMFAF